MRIVDLDDDAHVFCGEDGEYEKWNIDTGVTIDADKALRKAARKLAYIHTQIDLYDDRPELHEEAYWLEYLIDEDWKDGQID